MWYLYILWWKIKCLSKPTYLFYGEKLSASQNQHTQGIVNFEVQSFIMVLFLKDTLKGQGRKTYLNCSRQVIIDCTWTSSQSCSVGQSELVFVITFLFLLIRTKRMEFIFEITFSFSYMSSIFWPQTYWNNIVKIYHYIWYIVCFGIRNFIIVLSLKAYWGVKGEMSI